MGCDIHLVVECRPKAGGKWVGLYSSHAPISHDRIYAMQRDYAFFGEIAGVRGESSRNLEPKGLPDDASDLTAHEFHGAVEGTYHSASHLTLDEIVDCWLATRDEENGGAAPPGSRSSTTFDVIGLFPADDLSYRIVFWFDN